MTSSSTVATLKTVAGVDVGKIDRRVLKASYEKTLKKEAKAEIGKLVEELASHFQKVSAGKEILECENCGGGSPSSLYPDHCPFCGDADEDASASPEPVETKATNGVHAAAVPAAPESSTKAAKADKKKPTRALVVSPTAEIVPAAATVPAAVVMSEKDLDEAIARLRKARDAGASALWTLSVELRAIYDGDLWKLRNGEDGKPKYKAFSKFLAEEVDLHERTVYRMIEVTREFGPDQAQKYGVSILRGLLAAPKEDRAEILDKVGKGSVKGTRGVAREVEEIRRRKGVETVETGSKDTGRKKAAKTAAKASAKASTAKKVVTVAVPSGRKTVKLFARALKKTDAEKRAKRLGDRPWGKLECANGVTMFFAVVENGSGELELSVEARRED